MWLNKHMDNILEQLPIEHLSYSALKLFVSNPWQFKKNYILGLWDYKSSPSAIVGKATHKALEVYYTGGDIKMALGKGLEYIEGVKDKDVEWGKTGTREKIIKRFHDAINAYINEAPDVGKVIATEKKITCDFKHDGVIFPLPIKAVTDLVTQKDGLRLWDYKVVMYHTDKEQEQPDYIMQAIFNYFTIKHSLKETPKSMTFVEIKPSKSRDGSPQLQYYEIVYDKHPEYFTYFTQLYSNAIIELSNPNKKFLPNFGHIFSGKESWADFTAEIMDFDMPTQVSHKSILSKNVERSYVESEVDRVEAKSLEDYEKIEAKLLEFGVPVKHIDSNRGTSVTLHTFKPSRGVRMNKVDQYERDLALALEAIAVRIQAPIPGTGHIGIEIPNKQQGLAQWSDKLLRTGSLSVPVGVDIYGNECHIDLAKAPHLLVAGATGAGKSVAMDVFIHTLSQQNSVEELGLILIDPKRSEFFVFEDDPHLISSIITETEDANITLEWAIEEMENRYRILKDAKARNIEEYVENGGSMKRIVIIIDELADLILSADVKTEIEAKIVRLAQKSRAAGMHLIVATQRPSVDVVTGLLKANFPTRIAFMTSTRTDSQVVLDQPGAEQLIGNGDLLLMNPREKGLKRLQGFIRK